MLPCNSWRSKMTEVAVNRPTYQEFVKNFSWEDLLARTDWPMQEKFNLGHEICDRWANDPAKADQPALRYELKDGTQGSFTYSQLRDMSNQFANVLAGLGIKKGDRIGGLLSKNPAILPMLIGIWKLGAVYVPLFTAFAAPAVAYRLRHSETCAVVTSEEQLAKVREAQQSGEGLPDLQHVIVVTDENKALED